MFNHEPAGYECPFCRLVNGVFSEVNAAEDVVRRTQTAAAERLPYANKLRTYFGRLW